MRNTAMVTGSRFWTDKKTIFACLDNFNPDRVIHGGAKGADWIAHEWCRKRGRISEVHFPDWQNEEKAALRRNDRMIESRPDVVLAFPMPNSRGTRYTIKRAMEAGILTVVTEGK